MPGWLTRTAAIVITGLLVALAIGGALLARSCGEARTAKTTTALATGQAGAATASGRDAVDTVGKRMGADSGTDQVTRENTDAIRQAPGADTLVPATVRDAGLAGLCRRAAYRRDPKCVQHAGP